MAQNIIWNLDETTLAELMTRACSKRVSVEESSRQQPVEIAHEQQASGGLGSEIAALFADCGLDEPLELPPREPQGEPRVGFDDHS
jgi:hypothetical protein